MSQGIINSPFSPSLSLPSKNLLFSEHSPSHFAPPVRVLTSKALGEVVQVPVLETDSCMETPSRHTADKRKERDGGVDHSTFWWRSDAWK